MRVSGALFLVLLIAVGFVLYLTARDTTSSLDAVATVAADLREEGVTGRALDRDLARQMIRAMDDLVIAPDTIPEHVDDLKTFAATAAAWADAASTPSTELRVAVALRKTAGELRSQAISPSTAHLMRARQHLRTAKEALQSSATGQGSAGPGLATDGVRDRLENLEQSHQEQYQELDEELNQTSSSSSRTQNGGGQ